ncbi:MAG: peptidoglycan-binding protein [Candidatus Omnitrophica bacterium]|nr:peptidoglycan-binding protein [Candidatus Omnitrophota bacterium]
MEDMTVEEEETVIYVAPAIRSAPIPEKSVKVVMSKREIQKALRNAGYYQGPIDGKVGPKSKKAIREFQADNKLKVDGIAGTKTKRVLIKYLSK